MIRYERLFTIWRQIKAHKSSSKDHSPPLHKKPQTNQQQNQKQYHKKTTPPQYT